MSNIGSNTLNRRNFICSTLAASALTLLPQTLSATNPNELPEIALIGDSIRLGYAPLVAENFKNNFTIFSPKENGEHTVNLLKYAHLWIIARKSKVIHINAGLHDIKTLKYGRAAGNNLVPVRM